MKNLIYVLLFLIYNTILSGYFFNLGFKSGVLFENENTKVEFAKILNETKLIILKEKSEKELLFYDFNESILYQEKMCVHSIKELEDMLVELYVFSKAKESFFNNFLENSICIPKEEI